MDSCKRIVLLCNGCHVGVADGRQCIRKRRTIYQGTNIAVQSTPDHIRIRHIIVEMKTVVLASDFCIQVSPKSLSHMFRRDPLFTDFVQFVMTCAETFDLGCNVQFFNVQSFCTAHKMQT